MKRGPFVFLAIAFVFLALAIGAALGSAGQAPHCKMPDHLAVVAGGQGNSPAAVGYLASMRCVNAPSYSGWGELINIRANRPDAGLHLFPESVAWMPNRLRTEAASGGNVTVLHSVGGRLQTFAVFSNATARALADQIEAAAPGAPANTSQVLASTASPFAISGKGVFHALCGPSNGRAPDDPIVFPGQPGASHSHDFAGAHGTNAYSTIDTIKASPTDCRIDGPDPSADRSAYWAPTLYFNGSPVAYEDFKPYYQQASGSSTVAVVPFGLQLVAGNAHATGPQSTNVVTFGCQGGRTDQATLPRCGTRLKLKVFFPNCLRDDVTVGHNNTADATYATKAGCPAGFHAVVQLRAEFLYPPGVDNRGTLTFASGPYYTFHADFFNAWDPPTLDRFVRYCINAGRNCGTTVP